MTNKQAMKVGGRLLKWYTAIDYYESTKEEDTQALSILMQNTKVKEQLQQRIAELEVENKQLLQAFRASVLSEGEIEKIATAFVTNKYMEYQIIDTDGEEKTREIENGCHINITSLAKAIHKASLDNITKGEG